MKKVIAAFAATAIALLGCYYPLFAQSTSDPFLSYVIGMPAASSIVGTERIIALQGGALKTITPTQLVFGSITGDCTMAFPPAIVCTKSNGVAFAPSAFTDATNANNIRSGTFPSSMVTGLGTAAPLNVGTGGLNIPQLDSSGRLPAVDASQLTYGAILTATPTPVPGSGAFTSASSSIHYQFRGKLVWFSITVSITTNGTAASNVQLTVPWTFSTTANCTAVGRETASVGRSLQVLGAAGGNGVAIWNYDNSYPGGSGFLLVVTGVCETT